jgi:hypothetical protein
MPYLQEDAPPDGMDNVRDVSPTRNLGVVVDCRGADDAGAVLAHRSAFGDDQACRCALRIIFTHQGCWHAIMRRACARHRRHDYTIGQFQATKLKGVK